MSDGQLAQAHPMRSVEEIAFRTSRACFITYAEEFIHLGNRFHTQATGGFSRSDKVRLMPRDTLICAFIIIMDQNARFSGPRKGGRECGRQICCVRCREVIGTETSEWSIPNFSCSFTGNITSNSMTNLAFHSLLSRKKIIATILTTSLINFSLKVWENVLFNRDNVRTLTDEYTTSNSNPLKKFSQGLENVCQTFGEKPWFLVLLAAIFQVVSEEEPS